MFEMGVTVLAATVGMRFILDGHFAEAAIVYVGIGLIVYGANYRV